MHQDEITKAYQRQMIKRQVLYDRSEAELKAREILKRKETELMMSGAIIGKNAEARDAQLREATKEEHAALDEAERQKRFAALELELARDAVDMLRDCLRCEELEAKA